MAKELNKQQHEAIHDWLLALRAKEEADKKLELAKNRVINCYPAPGLYAFGDTIVRICDQQADGEHVRYEPTVHADGVLRCM